jgi:hypothetical protein
LKSFNLSYFVCLVLLFSCSEHAEDALFTPLSSSKTGIRFKNLVKESEEFNVLTYGPFYHGGGVAVGDINDDGLPDIYFTGNMMASKLYLNKGNFKFEDITDKAGVGAAGLWNTGTSMVDVNGDGLLDIYVCRSAANDPDNRRNLLFINNGNLTFREAAKPYGLDDPGYSIQATFFDFDRDGDLDMFLVNHSTQEYAGFSRIDGSFKNRKDRYIGNKLFLNTGNEGFVDITDKAGMISNVLGFGLAATVLDADNDGWLDVYVSNDYTEEDYFYLNQRNGTFQEALRDHFGHVSFFSMGADASDLNNDGLTDIITSDMLPPTNYGQKKILGPEGHDKYANLLDQGFFPQVMRNMLQLNQGNGYFSEIGQLAGIANTDWSWSVLAADYDNDGWKDILITNGYMKNYLDMDFLTYLVSQQINDQGGGKEQNLMALIEKMPPIKISNVLFKNNGNLTFVDKASEWGLDAVTVSNAAAYADLDNDGDLDLIICHTNEEAAVYRNNSESLTENNYLKVILKGDDRNSFGIGAKVSVYAQDKEFHQEMIPVRGFQSSVNPELVFGLGRHAQVDSIVVLWPDGRVQSITQPTSTRILTLGQKDSHAPATQQVAPLPFFAEVPSKLGLNDARRRLDILDFKQGRLMPNAISDQGSKVTKGDYNNDGLEDIYITGSAGQTGILYQQSGDGSFRPVPQVHFQQDSAFHDMDALFVDVNGDRYLDLYVVSGGSKHPSGSAWYQDRLYINDRKSNFVRQSTGLPMTQESGGSVAAADFDKDGDIDLFIGGRLVPGQYPQAPRSYLLRNDGKGGFEDVTGSFSSGLLHPGMVTDAYFSDFNEDGWEDLIIVGEWMEISIYINGEGRSFKRKEDAISQSTAGWWKTVEVADIDNDGDLDIVAGNQGLNHPYGIDDQRAAILLYKDFDGNGAVDPLLMYSIEDTLSFAYSRDELIAQIPSMKKKFNDYETFARTLPADFFTREQLVDADTLLAATLASLVLINDGKGIFSVKELPIEAQFSPLHAILIRDVDGDGNPDLLTGGNSSVARVSIGPSTANYGMVFLGDGHGGFSLFDPAHLGLNLRGDIRSIHEISAKNGRFLLYSGQDSLKVFKVRD